MTPHEEDLLSARFAARAPEPLRGDWDEVLDRAGATKQRRLRRRSLHLTRRRLVALSGEFLEELGREVACGHRGADLRRRGSASAAASSLWSRPRVQDPSLGRRPGHQTVDGSPSFATTATRPSSPS